MKDLLLVLLAWLVWALGSVVTLFAFGFPDHVVDYWWSLPALVTILGALMMIYFLCLVRAFTGGFR